MSRHLKTLLLQWAEVKWHLTALRTGTDSDRHILPVYKQQFSSLSLQLFEIDSSHDPAPEVLRWQQALRNLPCADCRSKKRSQMHAKCAKKLDELCAAEQALLLLSRKGHVRT